MVDTKNISERTVTLECDGWQRINFLKCVTDVMCVTWLRFPETGSHFHRWQRCTPWIWSCTPVELKMRYLMIRMARSAMDVTNGRLHTLARISPSWLLTCRFELSLLLPSSKMVTSSEADSCKHNVHYCHLIFARLFKKLENNHDENSGYCGNI